MTLEKAKLRASVMHDVGASFDDLLENAKKELHEREGALKAFNITVSRLAKIGQRADLDVEDATLTPSEGDLVKKYITYCCGVARNLKIGAEASLIKQKSRVEALGDCVKTIKHLHDAEVRKANQLQKYEDEGKPLHANPRERIVGTHPGDPLSDRKKVDSKALPASEEKSSDLKNS